MARRRREVLETAQIVFANFRARREGAGRRLPDARQPTRARCERDAPVRRVTSYLERGGCGALVDGYNKNALSMISSMYANK